MVGWHHQLNDHEFEQALGDGDGQGGSSTPYKAQRAPSAKNHLTHNFGSIGSLDSRVCWGNEGKRRYSQSVSKFTRSVVSDFL